VEDPTTLGAAYRIFIVKVLLEIFGALPVS